MSKGIRYNMNLTRELDARIRQAADKHGMPKTTYIVYILTQHFDKMDLQQQIAQEQINAITSKFTGSALSKDMKDFVHELLAKHMQEQPE